MSHVIILNDGNILAAGASADVQALAALANKNTTVAVKVGRKGLQKHLIAAVAPESALTAGEHNIAILLQNNTLYTTVTAPEDTIEKAVTDINKQQFVVVGDVLINRNVYQIIEELAVPETKENAI